MTWFSLARSSLRTPSSTVSLMPIPCSAGVTRPESDLEDATSGSLGLLVRKGFVAGELAGEADFGGGRGC